MQNIWDFEQVCQYELACHGARSGACSRNHTYRLGITDTTQIPSGVCRFDRPWNSKRCERVKYDDKCGFDHFAGYHQLRKERRLLKEYERMLKQEEELELQQKLAEEEALQQAWDDIMYKKELELELQQEYTGFELDDKYDVLYTVESEEEYEYKGTRSERAHQKEMESRGLGTKKQVKAYEKSARKHIY